LKIFGNISLTGIYKNKWGRIYVLLNAILSLITLLLVYKSELNAGIQLGKVLVAGTSAMGVLRVVAVNVKNPQGVQTHAVPMIEVILDRLVSEFDKKRAQIELKKIRPIVAGIDPVQIAENLPIMCSSLMKTLSREQGELMKKDIEELLKIPGMKAGIKSIILGVIISKYTNIEFLRTTLEELSDLFDKTKEEIKPKEAEMLNKLDDLIKKFSP
jgi:hypothetical protein